MKNLIFLFPLILISGIMSSQAGRVGIGTTSPQAIFHVDSSVLFTGTSDVFIPTLPPVSGAGTRLMWYPGMAVFRAGHVDGNNWDAVNTGAFSIAMGWNTTASGIASTALGGFTSATENYSTSLGNFTRATGVASSSLGSHTLAHGFASTVIGIYNDSIVAPQTTISDETPLFIIGNGNTNNDRHNAMVVRKDGYVGIGTSNPLARLHVDSTVVFGGNLNSTDPAQVPYSGGGNRMMWYPDKAAFRAGFTTNTQWSRENTGLYSFAGGRNTRASGNYSIALGQGSIASGEGAVALGYLSQANDIGASAIGYTTHANEAYSTALGGNTTANATYATAIGRHTIANGYASTVVGNYNDEIVPPQINLTPETPLFIVGNGDDDTNRSNALIVRKDGNVGIGTNSPVAPLHVDSTVVFTGPYNPANPAPLPITGSGVRLMWIPEMVAFRAGRVLDDSWDLYNIGQGSVAFGSGNKASGAGSIAAGSGVIASGDKSTAFGIGTKAEGNYATTIGYFTHATGFGSLATGAYNDPIVPVQFSATGETPLFTIGNGSFGNPSNAFVIRHNGKVSINTSDGRSRLTIQGPDDPADGPIMTLFGNSADQVESGRIRFVEGTGSTTLRGGYIHLDGDANRFHIGIQANSTDGDINAITINRFNANVGIGAENPSVLLQVGTSGDGSVAIANNWNTFSDLRYKKDLIRIENPLTQISEINGYSYTSVGNDPERKIGVIAQEVEQVFPEVVHTDKEGFKSVDYGRLSAILIEAVKELKFENEKLKEKLLQVDKMTSELDELKKMINKQFNAHTQIKTPSP